MQQIELVKVWHKLLFDFIENRRKAKPMEAILIIIGVIVFIAIVIVLYNKSGSAPEFWFGLFSFLDCCSLIGVFGVTLVITVGTFLLWHSLLVAGLVGASVMFMLFLVLSIAAASSRPASQS